MYTQIIAEAINAHNKTNHLYDGKPYAVHLAITAYFAQKYIDYIPDEDQEDVLSACWLHDAIEDARLTYNDVVKISNTNVADMVYAVTNEKGKNRKERANEKYYNGIKNIKYATFVKLCDRLANAKYSYENESSMFLKYKNELNDFIEKLTPNVYDYNHMVNELKIILYVR